MQEAAARHAQYEEQRRAARENVDRLEVAASDAHGVRWAHPCRIESQPYLNFEIRQNWQLSLASTMCALSEAECDLRQACIIATKSCMVGVHHRLSGGLDGSKSLFSAAANLSLLLQ